MDVNAVAREIACLLDAEDGPEEDDDFGDGDKECGHNDTDSDDSCYDRATPPSVSEEEEDMDEAAGPGGANTFGFETNTRNSRSSRPQTQYRSARPRRQALD